MRGVSKSGIVIVVLALLAVIVMTAEAIQRLQVTCTAPASGDAPTQYKVERETGGGSGAWDPAKSTVVATLQVANPLVFVDRTITSGTVNRYRCTAGNLAGDSATPSDPSPSFTLIGAPGKAGVQVIVITE